MTASLAFCMLVNSHRRLKRHRLTRKMETYVLGSMTECSADSLPPGTFPYLSSLIRHTFSISDPWGPCLCMKGSHRRTTQGILRTRYPITAGWTEAMWIQSLPKTSIHDRCCRESNPGPLDLESNALTTQPRTFGR